MRLFTKFGTFSNTVARRLNRTKHHHSQHVTVVCSAKLCYCYGRWTLFTVRRCDIMLARYILWSCVRLSVTSRCSIKMAKRMTTHTTPNARGPLTLGGIPMGSPTIRIGRQFSTNISLYLSSIWCRRLSVCLSARLPQAGKNGET